MVALEEMVISMDAGASVSCLGDGGTVSFRSEEEGSSIH